MSNPINQLVIDRVAEVLHKNLEPETLTNMRTELSEKTDGMDHDHPDVVLTDALLSALIDWDK